MPTPATMQTRARTQSTPEDQDLACHPTHSLSFRRRVRTRPLWRAARTAYQVVILCEECERHEPRYLRFLSGHAETKRIPEGCCTRGLAAEWRCNRPKNRAYPSAPTRSPPPTIFALPVLHQTMVHPTPAASPPTQGKTSELPHQRVTLNIASSL
jgi:hypothetical protein